MALGLHDRVWSHQNRAMTELVELARNAARQCGFGHSCTDETGQLLKTLCAAVEDGVVAEIGAGCGVGTAWMASGLREGVRLDTVESDPDMWRIVAGLFSGEPVDVVQGDWTSILERGPFALVFADVAEAKLANADQLLASVRPGGMILLDDLTPRELWPPEWERRSDPVRDFWLNSTAVTAAELRTSATEAVILAVRQ